ncbi:MAG: ribonuclease D [Alphaproteobacteria bacterium]
MNIITQTEDLAQFCTELATHPFVTIDTEFMRDRTYWSKLCLIQIAAPGMEAIVDPLVDIDLNPLYELLANNDVVKVFHAGRQDVEIFFHEGGVIPLPLFDTQVAAMVLGFGDSISYDALSRKVVGQPIDKSSRFTDWARRPLSDNQLTYALADVTHLRDIYLKLKAKLEQNGRTNWVEDELAILTTPATYDMDPEKSWRRVKPRPRTKQALAATIELAAWRERQAQAQNVPRNRIIKDDAIGDIANTRPATPHDLGQLRSIPKGFERSKAASGLLAAVALAEKRALDSLPELPKREPLPARAEPIVDLLKLALRQRARAEKVAPRLIASTDDLEQIVLNDTADVGALRGWRHRVFGELALKIKNGQVGVVVRKGRIAFEDQEEPEEPEELSDNDT